MDKVTEGRITSGEFVISSTLLDGYNGDIVLASSQNYTSPANFILKTSLSDFFKSVNALFCVGGYVTIVGGKECFTI